MTTAVKLIVTAGETTKVSTDMTGSVKAEVTGGAASFYRQPLAALL